MMPGERPDRPEAAGAQPVRECGGTEGHSVRRLGKVYKIETKGKTIRESG